MSTWRDSKIGLPLSRVSSRAISSACARIKSPSFQRMRWRSAGRIFGQGPLSNAARAARTARSTSSGPALATVQIGSSVAGLYVVKVSPEAASTVSPLMTSLAGCTGASVSVMIEPPLEGALEAPALDRIRMMTVVWREHVEHPAEGMIGAPDFRRFVGNAFDFLHQLLPDAMQGAHGIFPVQMAKRSHQLGVEHSHRRLLDSPPRRLLSVLGGLALAKPHLIAGDQVEHGLADAPAAVAHRLVRGRGAEPVDRGEERGPRANQLEQHQLLGRSAFTLREGSRCALANRARGARRR